MTYPAIFTMYITDATRCAAYQAAFPEGLRVSPQEAAATYDLQLDPAGVDAFANSCIFTYGQGSGNSGLTTALASVAVASGFVPDSVGNLQAVAGAVAGTFEWVGWFVFRGASQSQHDKEVYQSHRWMVGFERSNTGEGEAAGNPTQRMTRDASRTIDGLGLALRRPAAETVTMTMPTTGTGYPSKYSWERIYVRLRNYPVTSTMIWGCKGSVEGGTAALIQVDLTGKLFCYNKGNQAYPGTLVSQGGQLPLNQWVKMDILIAFTNAASGGSGDGGIIVFINGVQALRMAGAGPGGTTVGGAGGLLNTAQNHSQSYVGNEDAAANTMEIDYDDWFNKTQPQLFTGDDWVFGSHIQPVKLTGFDTGNGTWTGDWRSADGIPVVGASDFLTTALANQSLTVTTDYVDRQVGCSGFNVGLYSKTASGTVESLGYSINGGAAVMANVTVSSATWAVPSPSTGTPSIQYTAGGQQNAPRLFTLGLKYTRDAVASNREIQALQAAVEYVGMWGPEDGTSIFTPTSWPSRQGLHNAPYTDGSNVGSYTLPRDLTQAFTGTYTGNGTGQDITMNAPAHWIWIRPLTGGTGGARWWSSCLSGHDPLIETPNKGYLVRALQTTNSDTSVTSYKFRVAGLDANSNANGVVYQWTAFSDPAMRFSLNGAYLTLSGTASFQHNLFKDTFTPIAGFLLPELGTVAATTGLHYKGPGHATNAASVMNAAESATVCTFNTGSIAPKTILNLASIQTAYSLWRAVDATGASGAVAITNYTGDGTGSRNIALSLGGRTPAFAIVQPHNGVAYVRDPGHTGSDSTPINSAVASTTAITGFAANQITVNAVLNAGGIVYDVFAFPVPNGIIIPPLPPDPPTISSMNGWWTSDIQFTGAATLTAFPPTNPHDARDWQKINVFAAGNAGFHGGFPGPGCVVDNFFIYAGNDYQIGGTQPTIRVFDGQSDRLLIKIPDVSGVKTIAIMAMLAVGQDIYLTTLDSGTSAADFAGRVFKFSPITLSLTQVGTQFTTGEVPYALCWHMGRLFMGTNKASGAAAKVYWFRPGIDSAWTVDRTLTTDGVGGCMSLASYQGKLYVGCNSTAAMGTNKILVRDSLGAYTTSFTATFAGTIRASNGFPAMIVFNNNLYASYWNPDTTPDCYIKKFDGTSWTTVYTGTGVTVRPFMALFQNRGTLFAIGGGSALAAALISTSNGTSWTDLTGFLTQNSGVTALPIIGAIGA